LVLSEAAAGAAFVSQKEPPVTLGLLRVRFLFFVLSHSLSDGVMRLRRAYEKKLLSVKKKFWTAASTQSFIQVQQ
jgi:hypothetical protein